MKNEFYPEKDQTLNAEEFRRILNFSPNTFKKLLAQGKLPKPLPLGTRSRRWSRSVVMSFLNNPDNFNRNTELQA